MQVFHVELPERLLAESRFVLQAALSALLPSYFLQLALQNVMIKDLNTIYNNHGFAGG